MEDEKSVAVKTGSAIANKGGFSLAPRNYEEAQKFANMLSKTEMVPKAYRGKAPDILVAVQMGAEVGLPPMQALQNIAVINGRPSIWGDAAIALVKVRPECESIREYFLNKEGEKTTGDDYHTAVCIVKRKGQEEEMRTFSLDDAIKAGLKGKQGPWTQYEKRMLQMRARGFCLRDVFPDALKGLGIAEEVQDIPHEEIDVTPKKEEIVLPEFEVPEVDESKKDTILVHPEDSEDAEFTEMKEGETGEEMTAAEEDGGEVKAMSCDEMIERILGMDNSFEHKNWLKKHAAEINALSVEDNKAVMAAYADKGEELNSDGPPAEALSEEGYTALIEAAGDKDTLDKLWFDRIEKEVTDSKTKIRLRGVMTQKQTELEGK